MKQKGFTLIELLIVVAIIAILAAIAVPNFLEAQVRSKVARAQADMRSIATAIESYYVDHNQYPPASVPANLYVGYYGLTSPVSYMTTLPPDPFKRPDYLYGQAYQWNRVPNGYTGSKASFIAGWAYPANPFFESESIMWQLQSMGPNTKYDAYSYPAYDPTNGTVSEGDLYRWGP